MATNTLELLKCAWTASAGMLEPAYVQRVFPDRLVQMQCEYRLIRGGLLFPETEDGLAPFQRKWNPDLRYLPRW
jgi:hypothetical protein